MAQQEYEQSQAIDAPPEEVLAWLSDVGNLPKYLPPRRGLIGRGSFGGGRSGPEDKDDPRVPGDVRSTYF